VADTDDDRERMRRLTERLDVAAQRAERLLSDSMTRADRDPGGDGGGADDFDPERPPPSGWGRPAGDHRGRDRWLDPDELELLMAVLGAIRDRIPPELRRRLADAVRELLIALRALIDWYLELGERPAPSAPDVRDIPIV
jgi:hypothetical protein